MEKRYFVYILSNQRKVLYIGVTNNLERRVLEHKNDLIKGFTRKYKIHRLVHYETTPNIQDAIVREKELKGWRREKKVALIEENNPAWQDLSQEWYE